VVVAVLAGGGDNGHSEAKLTRCTYLNAVGAAVEAAAAGTAGGKRGAEDGRDFRI